MSVFIWQLFHQCHIPKYRRKLANAAVKLISLVGLCKCGDNSGYILFHHEENITFFHMIT